MPETAALILASASSKLVRRHLLLLRCLGDLGESYSGVSEIS